MRLLCIMVSVIPEAKHGEYLPAVQRTLGSLRRQELGGHSLHIALGDDGSHYLREFAGGSPRILESHETAAVAAHHGLPVDDIVLIEHTPHYNKAVLLNHYLRARLERFDGVLLLDDDHPFPSCRAIARGIAHLESGYDFVVGRLLNPDGTYRTYTDHRVQGTTLFFSRRLMEAIDFFGDSVQRWGCGEDSETFWRVYLACRRFGWRGAYDGNILTVDQLSGRWAACAKQAGGVDFFRRDFASLYGVDPHHNPCRTKSSWLDYIPMESGLDEAWVTLARASDGLLFDDLSQDPAEVAERIARARSDELVRYAQRLSGKDTLIARKNEALAKGQHELSRAKAQLLSSSKEKRQLEQGIRKLEGKVAQARKDLEKSEAKRLRGFWIPSWEKSRGHLNRQVAWLSPPLATMATRQVRAELRELGAQVQRASDDAVGRWRAARLTRAEQSRRKPHEPAGRRSRPNEPKTSSPHVCVAIGPWQLVALRAALEDGGISPREAVLVLYDQRVSAAQRRRWTAMAHLLGDWRRVVWLDDLVELSTLWRAARAEPRALLATVRERAGAPHASSVWLPKLFHAPEKLLAEAFPDAPLYLYEEGLASYLERPVYESAADLYASLSTRGVYGPHLNRLRAAAFFLPQCPKPTYAAAAARAVDARALRRALGELSFEHRPLIARAPRVVLVGQCLAENGLMKRADELELYVSVAQRIVHEGARVMWREHPRTRKPFGVEVADAVVGEGFGELDAPEGIPLEAILLRDDIAGVVGAFSSTLLYAPLLGEFPVGRIPGVGQALSGPDAQALLAIVERHVPAFEGCATLCAPSGLVDQAAE